MTVPLMTNRSYDENFLKKNFNPNYYKKYYQSFIYSPTDALVSRLKKTVLKFTILM